MAKLAEVEKELAETQRKLDVGKRGESSPDPLCPGGCTFSLGYFMFRLLRLLQLIHRGPAGRLYDRCAERGGYGFRRAQETPPACGQPAQRCPAPLPPHRINATHSDPVAVNVSRDPQNSILSSLVLSLHRTQCYV